MKTLKSLSRKEFKTRFGTSEQCLMYLYDQKWSNGYKCVKCGNSKSCTGRKPYNRRCTRCGYDESATAGTLFHKLKFGIENAFEMVYDIVTSKKGASSIWLAERYGVRQNTAWLFRRKLQQATRSSKSYPLEKEVHVDEFEIGTPQKGEQGRSKSEKKTRVVLAIEHRNGKSGRAYARVIEDYSFASLRHIFNDHISEDAFVVTDEWSGYKPLKKLYKNMSSKLSKNGQNFQTIHIQIRNLKNWLRGTHSYCNKENLNEYLDEYFFRFNRNNFRATILEKVLERMALSPPKPYISIKCNVA